MPTPKPTPVPTATPTPEPQPLPLGRPCSEFGDVTFTAPPMSLADIFYIRPMGAISNSHPTPTDHMYIHPRNPEAPPPPFGPVTYPPPFEVAAPGDGYIVWIDTMSGHLRPAPDGQPILVEDYYVEIYYSCALSSVYIHLNELAPEILEVTGEFGQGSRWFWGAPPDRSPIPVNAGQVIGKIGSSFDFSVHVTEPTPDEFATPPPGIQLQFYTVDPFDYFEEPLRADLLEKNLRAAEPRGGRFDFDIDGQLVGNWFLEGAENQGGRCCSPSLTITSTQHRLGFPLVGSLSVEVGASGVTHLIPPT